MSQEKMKIHGQYIKDLSFENPGSPFIASNQAPDISVMVNIHSLKLEGDGEEKSFHEVTLHVEIKATVKNTEVKDGIAFICDLKYCGIFSIEDASNYSEEELRRALFISGPTYLFPFIREVLARITSSGGFPPLMLDPIDFAVMYEEQRKNNANLN